jgi:hypothetical protein
MAKKVKKAERSKGASDDDAVYDDTDELDEDWVEEDQSPAVAAVEVEPRVLAGGNYDLRPTYVVNDTFVGHTITAPTTNVSRTATVTVANATPPTNQQTWWQGTPPTPYIAVAPNPPTTPAWETNSYKPGGASGPVYPVPPPDDTTADYKGIFKAAKDSLTTAGRPEAFGTEVHVNKTGAPVPLVNFTATHSDLGNYTEFPNQAHPSTLTPAGVTTLASISPTSTVSGAGTQLLTATGTNFTKQSVIVVNAVPQTTTFVSNTSITATVTKKATAGTWPVIVSTGGAQTAPQTWTFT